MSSCLPGSITYSVLGIAASFIFIGLSFLLNQFLQNFVQTLHPVVPEALVLPHPLRRLLEAGRLAAAGPPFRAPGLCDQAGALQHLPGFGDSGGAGGERAWPTL